MAAVSAVLGGVVGVFAALIGLGLFGLTLMQALGLWSGTGLMFTLALILAGASQRAVHREAAQVNRAHA
jgi:predicted lipid-binding transport protein (Tim44 family)